MDYIKVIVYSDGDTELTKVFVNSIHDRYMHILQGGVLFSEKEVSEGKLMAELKSYGHEKERAQEAITNVMASKINIPHII